MESPPYTVELHALIALAPQQACDNTVGSAISDAIKQQVSGILTNEDSVSTTYTECYGVSCIAG